MSLQRVKRDDQFRVELFQGSSWLLFSSNVLVEAPHEKLLKAPSFTWDGERQHVARHTLVQRRNPSLERDRTT